VIRIWAILILTGVLLQSFSRQLVFAEFLMNRDFISQMLCEKKLEPGNNCQGKCQLKKQLEKEEQRSEKNHQTLKNYGEVLFSQSCETINWGDFSQKMATIPVIDTPIVLEGYLFSIFRPPSC